ncbi:E1 ubiquitin-activating enzyme [Malassezia furfur]|uniref:Ubiquitin-like 1-activating enzyme E1A n=1 Tax=Malassezia furfur TaxID=55194 RepID=A0ABY8EUT1_MALFU|nr:E1 ubiquitin-activating enzyme [Malassezia furfur]
MPDGAPRGVTEDEAALYDRQIRLWGLEAQNRMRSAHVVVLGLTGVATEIIKNVVLSGVGRLTVVDDADVRTDDLNAGFFFRDSDVGHARVADAPLQRIQQLNPLVDVRGVATLDLAAGGFDALVACRGTRAELEAYNDAARRAHALFYAAAAQGWGGYVFSDLGDDYTYVATRATPGATERAAAAYTQTFVPLRDALHTAWAPSGAARRRPPPARLWATWALWAWEARGDTAPSPAALATALEREAAALLAARGVDDALVFARQRIDRAAFFAAFAHAVWPHVERQSDAAMPTTSAVLGGLVAQDLLNALGRREAPLVNWLLLDTSTGTAPVCAVGTPAPAARALGADGSL